MSCVNKEDDERPLSLQFAWLSSLSLPIHPAKQCTAIPAEGTHLSSNARYLANYLRTIMNISVRFSGLQSAGGSQPSPKHTREKSQHSLLRREGLQRRRKTTWSPSVGPPPSCRVPWALPPPPPRLHLRFRFRFRFRVGIHPMRNLYHGTLTCRMRVCLKESSSKAEVRR